QAVLFSPLSSEQPAPVEVRRYDNGAEAVLDRHGEAPLYLFVDGVALSHGQVKARGETVGVGEAEWMIDHVGQLERLLQPRDRAHRITEHPECPGSVDGAGHARVQDETKRGRTGRAVCVRIV